MEQKKRREQNEKLDGAESAVMQTEIQETKKSGTSGAENPEGRAEAGKPEPAGAKNAACRPETGRETEQPGVGRVHAICISAARGTEKHPVEEAYFQENFGIQGDAHAGHWHRQVSLLSYERVEAFNARGANVTDGAFGENLVVEGIDFRALPVGTLLFCGDAVLRMTQLGKECHSHCKIYQRMGECIMPTQGVFAEVLKPGIIKKGDEMRIELPGPDAAPLAAVLVASDKGSRGERVDESGPAAAAVLEENGYRVIEVVVTSDDKERIKRELMRLCDQRQAALVVTSGGTGLSVRDNTPEATMEVSTRSVPGIAEAIRAESMRYTKRAMLSRGVSVIRGQSLIVNLPGSPKGVRESLSAVIDTLGHGIRILRGQDGECARK